MMTMINGRTIFSKPGVRKECSRKILRVIGASITNIKAGAMPAKIINPQMVSVPFRRGKKYPVAMIPVMNSCILSGISG